MMPESMTYAGVGMLGKFLAQQTNHGPITNSGMFFICRAVNQATTCSLNQNERPGELFAQFRIDSTRAVMWTHAAWSALTIAPE